MDGGSSAEDVSEEIRTESKKILRLKEWRPAKAV